MHATPSTIRSAFECLFLVEVQFYYQARVCLSVCAGINEEQSHHLSATEQTD